MPDAVRGAYQDGLAADEPEHLVRRLFRARLDAGAAAQAFARVNERMQRRRFGESRSDGLHVGHAVPLVYTVLPKQVIPENQGARYRVYDKRPIHVHGEFSPVQEVLNLVSIVLQKCDVPHCAARSHVSHLAHIRKVRHARIH